jgi:hypothetical protein
MRTLIRSSQLHPDISGLVISSASGIFTKYSDISGLSGIKTFQSGQYLFVTQEEKSNVVLNNLTGNVFITGESGVYTRVHNQTIYIGNSGGAGSVGFISGYGNIDVWPLNAYGYAISGISITGSNGIETLYNPSKTLLTVKGAGIGKLNNTTGDVTLVGRNGAQINLSGQSIFIDANQAAFSGVNALNNLQGTKLNITGSTDININTNALSNTILVSYTGRGWGNGQLFLGTGNNSLNYIGNNNILQESQISLVQGNSNLLIHSTGVSMINAQQSTSNYNYVSSFINNTGSAFDRITGSTIINGIINNQTYKHPFSFGVGGSIDNTFSTNLYMKCFLSGQQRLKTLAVPKTIYSGIYLSTGSVIFGEINYVAVRYDITDFEASFDAKNYGIYGKKYFMAQRATNLQVDIKDESDLFGGINKYNLFLSGGNDERLYLWASGYSGNDPGDGVDGVHDVIFIANINFVNFSINPYL